MNKLTQNGERAASYVTTGDGVQIYYKDWGPKDGPVVTFSHGWPLSSDSWESQIDLPGGPGLSRGGARPPRPRAIEPALGRQRHGSLRRRSRGGDRGAGPACRHAGGISPPAVARWRGTIGRHGTSRVQKAVLVSAVTPLMLQTADNPGGVPLEVFDGIRKASLADRSQLYLDSRFRPVLRLQSTPFFGFNRPGAKPSQGMIQSFWVQGMQGGHKNTYDSIAAFSATDLRPDLAKFDVPTLIIHGDDDQVVPIDNAARAAHGLVRGSRLIVYAGAPHGITDTHKDRLNQDLLDFLRE